MGLLRDYSHPPGEKSMGKKTQALVDELATLTVELAAAERITGEELTKYNKLKEEIEKLQNAGVDPNVVDAKRKESQAAVNRMKPEHDKLERLRGEVPKKREALKTLLKNKITRY